MACSLCFIYTLMGAGATAITGAALGIGTLGIGNGGSVTVLSFKTGSGGAGGGRKDLGICFISLPGLIGLI